MIFIITGILLILLPIGFNVVFFLLQRTFEYPDILRKPTGYILEQFQGGGKRLVATWYAFMLAALLFLPLGILLPMIMAPGSTHYITIAAIIGVLASMFQVLGLIRWPFLVPYLARTYTDPGASQTTRDSVEMVFQAFHRYAGVAIGEHMGYLFTSLWTVVIAAGMISYPAFPAWLGWVGLLPAAGIFVGLFEESGFKSAGAINAISYILWSLWLVLTGIIMVFVR
jgi:hypothetical protein